MALLPIRVYPDPVLRVRCPEVETFDGKLRRLARDMVETMYAAPGVGLAAPQVGVELRLAVVDVSDADQGPDLHVLVNPEIVEQRGSSREIEGCLSIPEVSETVERPAEIRVRARDLEGNEVELEAGEWLARAICHEIDHLNGVLFVDHLRGLKREKVRRKLKRLARESEVQV